MPFKIGEILQGEDNSPGAAVHPIIYIGETEEPEMFLGTMLTHQKKHNIKLDDNHFSQKPEDDGKNSFFVSQILLKNNQWGPFTVIGSLSDEGIEHLMNSVADTEPMTWEEAIENIE